MSRNMESKNDDQKPIDEESNIRPKCCWYFDPSYNRFMAAALVMLLSFVICYCVDIPGSLQSQIQNAFDLNVSQFEIIYSIGGFPSIVLSVVGGILVDRVFGLFKATAIFSLIGFTGQVIFVIGGYCRTYWVMLLGRFIYGSGSSIVEVSTSVYLVLWFQGKEINFIFGLGQTVGRLGTSAVFLASSGLQPFVYKNLPKNDQLGTCLLQGVICTLVIIACVYILGYFSKRNGINIGKQIGQEENNISFWKTLNISLPMFLICVIIAAVLTSVTIFNSMAQTILSTKYNMNSDDANRLASTFNIIGALTSPIPGIIIDKTGRDVFFNMFGQILGIASFIILAATEWNPYIFLTLFAISYSVLNSCTWPLIARIVEPYQLGTAYGIAQSVSYLSSTVFFIFAGYLVDTYGISAVIYFFITFYLVGTACIIVIWLWDNIKGDGLLNMSAYQRHQLEIKNAGAEENKQNLPKLSNKLPSVNVAINSQN